MTNLKLNINKLLISGQSLFEVVVAVAVSSLIITAIVALAASSIQNSSYSRDKTIASNYVQETLEWLRQEKERDPALFRSYVVNITGADMTYCFKSLSWPVNPNTCSAEENIEDTKFFREVTFPACDGICDTGIVEVRITVTWQDSKGSHIISSSSELTTI